MQHVLLVTMRIVHFEDTGGVSEILRDQQKWLGHQSSVVVTWKSPTDFGADQYLPIEGSLVAKLKCLSRNVKLAADADLIHVHGGLPLRRLDYVYLAIKKRKKMVAHLHGSETRGGYGLAWLPQVDRVIVATPDLLKNNTVRGSGAVYIPNPVNIKSIPYCPSRPANVVRIGHFPTNPELKGTDLVHRAVAQLAEEGVPIELVGKPGNQWVPHNELLKLMQTCDVVIDQVAPKEKSGIDGIYGMTSIEAMAMGKIVISNVDQEYRETAYEGCPIVQADPNLASIKSAIKDVVDHPDQWRPLAMHGRVYVEEVHDALTVALSVQRIYEEILTGA